MKLCSSEPAISSKVKNNLLHSESETDRMVSMKNKFRIAHRIARNVMNTEASNQKISAYIDNQLRINEIPETLFDKAWAIVASYER